MSFSFKYTATSKDEAIKMLDAQSMVPQSVRAFILTAIDGFREEGGNTKILTEDVATRKTTGGEAANPVSIAVEASGHLDSHGNGSNCTITVAKAAAKAG